MKLFDKLRWVASILLVFFIVVITNIIDKDNFNQLSYSVTTIYEDRIVASDLLFDMSSLIHQKEIALVSADSSFLQNEYEKVGVNFNNLLSIYEETRLTEREIKLLGQLKDEIATLQGIEEKMSGNNQEILLEAIQVVKEYLHELSKIQLEEAHRQVLLSDKAKNTINLFTQGEIIFLILMGIMVQIIIFYQPKKNDGNWR